MTLASAELSNTCEVYNLVLMPYLRVLWTKKNLACGPRGLQFGPVHHSAEFFDDNDRVRAVVIGIVF